MDNFFYNLNDKLNAIRATPETQLNESAVAEASPLTQVLNERSTGDYSAVKAAAGKDIGKPGKNFSKIAAGAAKRYGSAEAGKRVAGAVLNKLRHPSESIADEGNAFSGAVVRAKSNGVQPGEKINVGGKEYPVKEAAKWRDPEHKGKLYTQEPGDNDDDDYLDLHWNDYGAKTRPKNDPGVKRRMGGVGSEYDRTDPLIKGFGRSGTGSPLEKGPRKGLPARDQIRSLKGSIKAAHGTHAEPNLPEGGGAMPSLEQKIRARLDKLHDKMEPEYAYEKVARQFGMSQEELQHKLAHGFDKKMDEAGGIPRTPKQKRFAKLAPPVDKITFADRIVGAKKEVDEVLGDVAANAMKKAVQGRNHDMEEGFMDDEPYSRKSSTGGRIDTTRAGVTRHHAGKSYSGAGHDAGADDAPRSGQSGRRTVGAGQGTKIGANSRGTSKLVNKPAIGASGKPKSMTKENDQDPGEYDREGEMAKDDIKTVVRHAQALEKILGNNDNLPEWVQAKLAKIEGMMTAVDDYMQNQKDGDIETEGKKQHFDKGYYDSMDAAKKDNPKSIVKARKQPFEEESDNTRDDRAEKAGKRVAKDIEYDEKKKDGIHGQRRDSEDSKAERAGRKVTKDIEYDEKKDKKKKEVDETTSSGSVATGGAAPKSGGGMSYGKGIYDSMNREVEKMISESMSINMSMNNDSHGGPSNTLTVTATDEDALQLAMLLKSAGLGSQEHNDMSAIHDMDNDMSAIHDMDHGHGDETCPACGSSECECDSVDEAYGDTDATNNEPDYPTDEVGTDDAIMYSGGLDGPKSTGQSTIPVIAGQDDRMGYEGDDALRRMMEMAGLSEGRAATPQDVPEDPPEKPAAPKAPAAPKTPGTKLATPQAVPDPSTKIKESLLAQLRNFKY